MYDFTNPYLKCLKEIYHTPDSIPSKQEYVNWYNKNIIMPEDLGHYYGVASELLEILDNFETLIEYIKYEKDFVDAIKAYRLLNLEDEIEVLEWLLKFEKLAVISDMFCCLYFHFEPGRVENDKIIICQELRLKVALNDVKSLIDFNNLFEPIAHKYKRKFTTNDYDVINTPLLELLELHNIVEFCGTTINEEALERYYKTTNQ